jgi:hypothetical protein
VRCLDQEKNYLDFLIDFEQNLVFKSQSSEAPLDLNQTPPILTFLKSQSEARNATRGKGKLYDFKEQPKKKKKKEKKKKNLETPVEEKKNVDPVLSVPAVPDTAQFKILKREQTITSDPKMNSSKGRGSFIRTRGSFRGKINEHTQS